MSVREEIIYIYESCPVAVLIFRFRKSVAFLKSRIRWERGYLPTYLTSPLGQFPSNTAITTTTTTTSWDSRGTLVLKVPSIHQSIKQYSGYQNDTRPLSSNPSGVAGPGQTKSSLTRTNEQTEQGSKQAKQHVQHQKNGKQRSTGRPFISEYIYSTKPKKKKTPKSSKKEKTNPNFLKRKKKKHSHHRKETQQQQQQQQQITLPKKFEKIKQKIKKKKQNEKKKKKKKKTMNTSSSPSSPSSSPSTLLPPANLTAIIIASGFGAALLFTIGIFLGVYWWRMSRRRCCRRQKGQGLEENEKNDGVVECV